jgi:hypothetical protein
MLVCSGIALTDVNDSMHKTHFVVATLGGRSSVAHLRRLEEDGCDSRGAAQSHHEESTQKNPSSLRNRSPIAQSEVTNASTAKAVAESDMNSLRQGSPFSPSCSRSKLSE